MGISNFKYNNLAVQPTIDVQPDYIVAKNRTRDIHYSFLVCCLLSNTKEREYSSEFYSFT